MIPKMKNSCKNRTNIILRIVFTVLTIFIMVFIFAQSAMPDEQSVKESNVIVDFITGLLNSTGNAYLTPEILSYTVRKLAHFTEYTVFGISLCLTAHAYFGQRRWIVPAFFAFGVFYAATDEFHQTFVSGRYGSAKDVLIDSLGLALGLTVTYFIIKRKTRAQIESGDSGN